jgi:hypothetical protein
LNAICLCQLGFPGLTLFLNTTLLIQLMTHYSINQTKRFASDSKKLRIAVALSCLVLSACALDKIIRSAFGNKVAAIAPATDGPGVGTKRLSVSTVIAPRGIGQMQSRITDVRGELGKQAQTILAKSTLPNRKYFQNLVLEPSNKQLSDAKSFDSHILLNLTALNRSEDNVTREGSKCRDPKKFFCTKKEDSVSYKYSCKVVTFSGTLTAAVTKAGETKPVKIKESTATFSQDVCGDEDSFNPKSSEVNEIRVFNQKAADTIFGKLVKDTLGTWVPQQTEVPNEFIAVTGGTADMKASLEAANKSAENGDVASAVRVYKQLESMGLSDQVLFYNLGFAAEINGDFEEALLYYEKAITTRGPLTKEVDKRKYLIQGFLTAGVTSILEPVSAQ